jgi:hypothetical protein
MPLVLAPPLNLQRTLSPAVRRLPVLLGCEAKESAGGAAIFGAAGFGRPFRPTEFPLGAESAENAFRKRSSRQISPATPALHP